MSVSCTFVPSHPSQFLNINNTILKYGAFNHSSFFAAINLNLNFYSIRSTLHILYFSINLVFILYTSSDCLYMMPASEKLSWWTSYIKEQREYHCIIILFLCGSTAEYCKPNSDSMLTLLENQNILANITRGGTSTGVPLKLAVVRLLLAYL